MTLHKHDVYAKPGHFASTCQSILSLVMMFMKSVKVTEELVIQNDGGTIYYL